MSRSRLSLRVLGIVISLALILCAGLLPAAALGGNTVGIEINPATTTASLGDEFSVDIKVTISAGEQVIMAEAYIDFYPDYLEVVSITPGTVATGMQYNVFNNTLGTIQCSGGAMVGEPALTEDFVLATLNLRAKAATENTSLSFVFDPPARDTTVTAVVGDDVSDVLNPSAVVNGSVEILPPGSLSGHVDLQGRPAAPHASWVTPLTVVFFAAGTDTVVRTENVTTDNTGNFTVPEMTSGTYDVGVKCSRSLSNLISGVSFSSDTVTAVDFGTLREGDANNDDAVTEVDYSILLFYYAQSTPEALDSCDFNRDGAVSGIDYALLQYNYGQMGDMYGMWP